MNDMPINRRAKCEKCGTYLGDDGRCPHCAGETLVERNRARVFSVLAWILGLERPEKFDAKSFFGKIFARHADEELTETLNRGYLKTIPAISDISTDWPSPWLFARIFAFTAVMSLLLHFGIAQFAKYDYGHTFLIMTSFFVDSALIPLSVLVFYYEMNVRKSVSLRLVGMLFLMGGAASLCFTMIIHPFLVGLVKTDWMGASVAGLIEEPAKLLAVLIFAKSVRRHPYILDGLIMGAAVGAGFAVFESCGYSMRYYTYDFLNMSQASPNRNFFSLAISAYESSKGITFIRAWMSPFGHVTWTAIATAAFFLVKGSGRFRLSMLLDFRFVRIFLISVALHMFWNSQITAVANGVYIMVIMVAILELMVLFTLIAYGLKQLKSEKKYVASHPWECEDGMGWAPAVSAAVDESSRPATAEAVGELGDPTDNPTRRHRLRKSLVAAVWIVAFALFGVFCEYQSQEYRNRIVDLAGRFTIRRFADCDYRAMNAQNSEYVMAMPSVGGEPTPEVRILVQRGMLSLLDYVEKNVKDIESAGGAVGSRATNTGDGSAMLEFAYRNNGVDVCAYCVVQQVIGGFYICRGSAPATCWQQYRNSIVKSVKSFKVDKKKGILK